MPISDYDNPANRGLTAQEIAEKMHCDSVDLWNAAWDECNRRDINPALDKIEQIQRMLGDIAWPRKVV